MVTAAGRSTASVEVGVSAAHCTSESPRLRRCVSRLQVRSLSVKRITNPVMFDKLNNPLRDGKQQKQHTVIDVLGTPIAAAAAVCTCMLRHYRLRNSARNSAAGGVARLAPRQVAHCLLSPTWSGLYDPAMGPTERKGVCGTCKQDHVFCPGHFGRVELPVPVYNPVTFGWACIDASPACRGPHRRRLSRPAPPRQPWCLLKRSRNPVQDHRPPSSLRVLPLLALSHKD